MLKVEDLVLLRNGIYINICNRNVVYVGVLMKCSLFYLIE